MFASVDDAAQSTKLAAAYAASDSGDWDLAAELWDGLRSEHPGEALHWLKSGEAYCRNGSLDRAEAILEKAVGLFSSDLWTAYQYTVVAQQRGEGAEALRRAETLRSRFPQHAIGWVLVAEAYRSLGRLDDAEAVFADTVERFPGDEWALYGYAQLAAHRGRWNVALSRWEAMLAAFPHHQRALFGWGEALAACNRLEEAEAALAAVLEDSPGDENGLVRYTCLAAHRRRWAEALERWRSVLQCAPVPALVAIAGVMLELGGIDAASAAVADILARDPDNAGAGALQAVLAQTHDPHQAVAHEVRRRGIDKLLADRVANPEVFIEITSICNFACTYCVSPMKLRDKTQMSLETFRHVLEQVATITTNPVRLHIDGEPTAHPQFREMALLVNSYGLPVWLATNGSRLHPSHLDIWMDPLISMSTLPEELRQRHRRLDFNSYIDRIAKYCAAWARSQSRQNLFFQIIYYPQDEPDADAAYRRRKDDFLVEFCRRAGLYDICSEETSATDEVYRLSRNLHPGTIFFIKQPVSSGGLYPVDGKMLERERATAGFCDSPWRQLVIHSDGTLGACCVDLSGGTTFADAKEVDTVPIRTLWQSSPRIQAMRENFLRGRVERDVCQRCLQQGQVAFSSACR